MEVLAKITEVNVNVPRTSPEAYAKYPYPKYYAPLFAIMEVSASMEPAYALQDLQEPTAVHVRYLVPFEPLVRTTVRGVKETFYPGPGLFLRFLKRKNDFGENHFYRRLNEKYFLFEPLLSYFQSSRVKVEKLKITSKND